MQDVSKSFNDKSAVSEFGKINLIIGPMFSCKSTELLRLVKKNVIAKKKILLIKHVLDDRFSKENCSTHDLVQYPAMSCDSNLMDYIKKNEQFVSNYDAVFIDEGQFFCDIDQFSVHVSQLGKDVTIAALNGDKNREPFPSVSRLIAISDSVKKLSAICTSCYKEASFTVFKGVTNCSVIDIGGDEKYQAVCAKCHYDISIKYNGATSQAKFV